MIYIILWQKHGLTYFSKRISFFKKNIETTIYWIDTSELTKPIIWLGLILLLF
jgi:hypothetical protein